MIIETVIFKQIKNAGKRKEEKINLFPYATKLYEILYEYGIVEETKKTALLGSINVKKGCTYSRFDYIMMQIYIYQFVKKHLNGELELSLGNEVKSKEFKNSVVSLEDKDLEQIPSIADVLQILSIIYNIGHFKSTFTSSRAMIDMIKSDDALLDRFISNFKYEKHKEIARVIIESNNYHRFHLLNSLLLLCEKKDKNKIIHFSINILTEYLTSAEQQSEKIQYIFKLFKYTREISFLILDLSIAPVPIYIDIYNDSHLKTLLKERLSAYNNKKQIAALFQGLNKLLQDTVYNEEVNALVQYDIARRMTRNGLKSLESKEAIGMDYLKFVKSNLNNGIDIFNRKYSKNIDFEDGQILKISFDYKNQSEIEALTRDLNKINFIKAAWYFRINENKVTLLISIKKKCKFKNIVALKATKLILNYIYRLQNKSKTESYHDQILLTTKHLLFYVFNEHRVTLEGKLDQDKCVILDKGYKRRIDSIRKLIKETHSENVDDIHEIETLKEVLKNDKKNDIGLTVCSSIVVRNKEGHSKEKAEFDGLIIFPNRKEYQFVFVESKNTKDQPRQSKKCLVDKFNRLEIEYIPEDIEIFNMDCKYFYKVL